MSIIEASALAASISDLTAGSDRATIAEALQIIINARQLPGVLFTRADVTSAAAVELGRKEEDVPAELVDATWATLKPWGSNMLDSDWDRVREAVCDTVFTLTTGTTR